MLKKRYVIFNKPYGVVSTFTDELGRKTLKNYIDVPDIYAAGRLDRDSEGLLLLTDDGKLIRHLTDPDFHLPKTYLAQVEGVVTSESIVKLEQGVLINGRKTRRCQVIAIADPGFPPRSEKPITPHGPTDWLRIVLREGRKRQIRHMTATEGLPVLRLIRVAIGNIHLGNLLEGQWRYLLEEEVEVLKNK